MINGILFFVLIAGTFYTAILYGSEVLVLVAIGEIIYVVLAYLYLICQSFWIKSSLVIPIVTVETGNSITMQIKTTNKGWLPSVKIKYQIRISNSMSKYHSLNCLTGTTAAQNETIVTTRFVGNMSGGYEASIVKMKLYDLTGLFYMSKKGKEMVEFQVLPDFFAINVMIGQASKHFVGETDVYEDRAGGTDQSELLQIREFRDGDKIQSIHWKLSAKTDELMVRENKLPLGCPVVVLLDLYTQQKRGSLKQTGAFLQLVSSLSFSLLEQKCAHYVAWYCGKEQQLVRVRVEKEEDLYLFLMLFYREEPNLIKIDLREAYRQKYKMETYSTDLCVDRELHIWQNGSLLKQLSAEQLETECEKLELIV